MHWFWKLMIGLTVMAVLVAVFFPAFNSLPPPAHKATLSQFKQLATTVLIYQTDYDDRFPPAPSWATVTKPYRKTDDLLKVRETTTGFSVAFMRKLQGKTLEEIAEPRQQVSFFETTQTTRMAHLRTSGGTNIAKRPLPMWIPVCADFGRTIVAVRRH